MRKHSPPHQVGRSRQVGAATPAGVGANRQATIAVSTLYVVGTPIGNLEDVSARALRILGEVGAIAAEDTRVTARLLTRHGLRKPLISYRAPVERRGLPRVMAELDQHDVALVSDAGTPTVSDPGQALVTAAWAARHTVVPIHGPRSR